MKGGSEGNGGGGGNHKRVKIRMLECGEGWLSDEGCVIRAENIELQDEILCLFP